LNPRLSAFLCGQLDLYSLLMLSGKRGNDTNHVAHRGHHRVLHGHRVGAVESRVGFRVFKDRKRVT
jgi:hypothetical protein